MMLFSLVFYEERKTSSTTACIRDLEVLKRTRNAFKMLEIKHLRREEML